LKWGHIRGEIVKRRLEWGNGKEENMKTEGKGGNFRKFSHRTQAGFLRHSDRKNLEIAKAGHTGGVCGYIKESGRGDRKPKERQSKTERATGWLYEGTKMRAWKGAGQKKRIVMRSDP